MSDKITFKELVELISEQSSQSQSSTNSFIKELVGVIESGLRESGSVRISGFGKFELRWMKERTGVHPRTGEEMTIPAQNKVVFKPYKALRTDVNKLYSGLKPQILSGETGTAETTPPAKEKETKNKETEEKPEGQPVSGEEPPLAAASAIASSAEKLTVDDLLIEKERPFLQDQEQSDTAVAPGTPRLPDESKLAEEVRKSGGFRWSYAAAVVIVLIAFLLLYFMMQRSADSPSLTTSEQPALVSPAEPENDGAAGDASASSEPEASVSESGEDSEPPEQTSFETEEYNVQEGESLWTIAEERLGNPYLWPLLYHLNGDILDNPNQLAATAELEIPDISDPDNLNSFEREQVALGYFDLYEWNRANNPEEARFFLWAVGVFSPDLLDNPPSDVDSGDLAFARNR